MDDIDRIRAFNRFYTRRLGLLGRSYLDSGLGVTEARLLYDLDIPDGAHDPIHSIRARDLARSLGLDEAYVSRRLKTFEARGLIRRPASAGDGRQRDLSLTPQGQALVARLKAQSRAAIRALLEPLPPEARRDLAQSLDRAQRLLETDPGPVDLRALAPGDGGWIVGRHGALYAADEGFDASFEALVAEIVAGFLRHNDPARERGWIAWRDGVRLGSIFCVAEGPAEPETARLRLFLLEPGARGSGLAQRMLDTCLDFARGAGYRRMRLWTHESHRAAGRLYARNGFALCDRHPAHSFGVDVVEQSWERAL